MTDDLLHRFSAYLDLTPRERTAIRETVGHPSSFYVGGNIRMEDAKASEVFFLHEGWVLSSLTYPDGRRQVVKIHRAGDIMGDSSLPFETTVESLVALTPARVSAVPLNKLSLLLATFPRLSAVFLLLSQGERIMLMDRLAVAGQLSAKHGVATLLLLVLDGRPPSDEPSSTIHFPLTQPEIADVLGLSTVHVNRVIVALEAAGLIKREGYRKQTYELLDILQLRNFVGIPARVRRCSPFWLSVRAP